MLFDPSTFYETRYTFIRDFYLENGRNMAKTAKAFGITRQRVHQILDKNYKEKRKRLSTGVVKDA